MFLNFIAINGQVLNLNSVVLVEDTGTDEKAEAVVTTLQGIEFTFEGDDALALFERMDLIVKVNDIALAQVAGTQGVNQ